MARLAPLRLDETALFLVVSLLYIGIRYRLGGRHLIQSKMRVLQVHRLRDEVFRLMSLVVGLDRRGFDRGTALVGVGRNDRVLDLTLLRTQSLCARGFLRGHEIRGDDAIEKLVAPEVAAHLVLEG